MLNRKRAIIDSVLLSGASASFYMGMTMHMSFVATFFTLRGYSATQIGIVVMVTMLVNLVMQPVWGFVSDKTGNIKRVLILLFALSIPVSISIPLLPNEFRYMVAIYALFACFRYPINGILDSLISVSALKNSVITYSVARGMGSAFSAIIAFFGGTLLDRIGIEKAFPIECGFYFLAICCLLAFSGKSYRHPSDTEVEIAESKERVTLSEATKELIKNRAYMLLLLSVVLVNIGTKAALTYTPVMINEFGGTISDNGYSMAINTSGMLPCMLIYSYMSKRGVSNNKLYILACLFTIARIMSLTLVKTVPALLAVQILNSMSFGFLQPATIAAISEVSPVRLRTTAITLNTSVWGAVGSVLGGMVAGKVIDNYGSKVMFTGCTVLAVLGIIVFFIVINEMKHKKPEL
jgi:PPP family 3-phenylpropionic acid transporter